MLTFMFPGQGSQAKGMGNGLFERFPELTEKADRILGYSIQELCLEDPRRELNKTQFTQPAIFVVSALSYYARLEDEGVKPNYVVGHSLGEFNALLAAECFDFEAGLKLVKKRGELMSQAPKGGMAAVLNSNRETIERILKENNLTNIDLANYNTPSQIVLSGSIDEIGKAQEFFQGGEVMYCPLNTSGAFHSRFMTPIKEKFEAYLKRFKLSEPVIPVIANVTALPYDANSVADNLSLQIATGVMWCDSIQYLMREGELRGSPMNFQEVGYGDVLTKMVAKIQSDLAKANNASAPMPTPVQGARDADWPLENNAADILVKEWNNRFSIGTKVRSLTLDYPSLETSSEATLLFGHRAAVYMKGYNGYFDLREIQPL